MLITQEVVLLIFTVAGTTLKLADNYEKTAKGYVFAAISAICMGLLLAASSDSAAIILGIIIGVLIAGKVDQVNLIFGLGLTLVSAMFLGFNFPPLPLLVIVSAAALIDEIGHDKTTSNSILGTFLRFRLILKLTIVLLMILTWIDPLHMIGFFCFDIAYDVTDITWKFYQKQQGK